MNDRLWRGTLQREGPDQKCIVGKAVGWIDQLGLRTMPLTPVSFSNHRKETLRCSTRLLR